MIEGVRAGCAIAAVVALGQFLPEPDRLRAGLMQAALMQAALGAMLTCLCDAGGPVRGRLPALLLFGVLGAVATAGFGMLRAHPIWAVPPAVACVFLASLARIYGQSAMQVGNLLVVVLVLALRQPLDARHALFAGATFLAGSLWATLLTLVLWRIYPSRPGRAAVFEIYRALAALCADLRRLLESGERDEAVWDRHARAYRRVARQAIETARTTVLEAARAGGAMGERTARAWVRLEAAEQVFGGLVAMAEIGRAAEDGGDDAPGLRARVARMARLLGPILMMQGRAILADSEADRPGLDRAVAAVATVARPPPGAPATEADAALSRVADYLVERLRATSFLSDARATPPPSPEAPPRRWWAAARAALRPDSASLRHALRTSFAAGLALAATMAHPLPYAHWFTITLVLTMQPYFAPTFARAVERIGGTVLGGVLAAAVATVATTPIGMSLALFPLAVAALAVRAVSFGLFMAFLTPVVILLSELGQPGTSEWSIALARAGFTVAGGLLALLLAWALWPSWEPARVREELSAAIRAHGAFAAAGIARLLGEGDPAALAEARRAAGVASNALEASLQRALLEPRRDTSHRLEAALTVDAALRRMSGRVTGWLVGGEPAQDVPAWRAWAAWITAATEAGTESVRRAAPHPPLPEGDPRADALARIAAQVEVIAGALGRVGTTAD